MLYLEYEQTNLKQQSSRQQKRKEKLKEEYDDHKAGLEVLEQKITEYEEIGLGPKQAYGEVLLQANRAIQSYQYQYGPTIKEYLKQFRPEGE